MQISQKMKNMETSSVRKLTRYADAAKARGLKVYHLNIGQPDLNTPEKYFQYIKNFDDKSTEYMMLSASGKMTKLQNPAHFHRRANSLKPKSPAKTTSQMPQPDNKVAPSAALNVNIILLHSL